MADSEVEKPLFNMTTVCAILIKAADYQYWTLLQAVKP
jgi:hypothetical protein